MATVSSRGSPAGVGTGKDRNTSSGPGTWRFRCANFYLMIILFSVPLFSVPCSKGICTTPVEVIAGFLFSQGLLGEGIAKAMLYPGAIMSKAESVMADNEAFAFPNWDTLLQDFEVMRPSAEGKPYPQVKIGFVFGCILCLVGAILSPFGPSFISALGMLTLLWYIFQEGRNTQDVYAFPMFGLAILCSFAAFNFDWFLTKQKSRAPASSETESSTLEKKSL